MRRLALLACVFALTSSPLRAQPSAERMQTMASQAADLVFPNAASSLSIFSSPQLALYKPEGKGPFPAVILLHQCGGLRSGNGAWQNMAMLSWAKQAVAKGYVALLLDSLGPRNVDTVCGGPKGGVTFPRGVRDVYQAADYLKGLDFVDPDRIVLGGYSWGAMVGLLASRSSSGSAFAKSARIRAVVSMYPRCSEIRPPSGAPYELLGKETDIPLLVLMGAADTEAPPEECTSRLGPIKDAGSPVEWYVYPATTHCWDCENLNGFRKTSRGNAVEYRFNREATTDAAARMFAFFDAVLMHPGPH